MAEEPKSPDLYVFGVAAVRRSIDSLLKNKNHEHVPGYLALLRSQKVRKGTPSQISDIVEVYDRYLEIPDVEGDKPYLRPFVSRGRNIWFNDNVSGSYAPSNVKAEPGPFFRVINVTGNGLNTTYTLPDDHAARASLHLLKGHKLPVTALTAFLYRDYGLRLATPTIESAVAVFRDEFCLRSDDTDQNAVFGELFVDDMADYTAPDLELLQG